MNFYKKSEWKEFREHVIELDEFKCSQCKREESEVTLQVHHKIYIKGRKPWEYATKDCITLCKGCHAEEHGIIKPKTGWEYIGDEDLGELNGYCDNCGTSIRYSFFIYHKNWGTIQVGTLCSDNLTDSEIASNQMESAKKYESRKNRFLNSSRWKKEHNTFSIKQSSFEVKIINEGFDYYIRIDTMRSKTPYKSLKDAKSKVFDVIESGALIEYMKNHNIFFRNKKR